MTYKVTALHPIEKKILQLLVKNGSLTVDALSEKVRLDRRPGEERSGTAKIQETHSDHSGFICPL